MIFSSLDSSSNTLLYNLLHLCATLQSHHPALRRRIFAEKYTLAAMWNRGDLLQIQSFTASVFIFNYINFKNKSDRGFEGEKSNEYLYILNLKTSLDV